MADIFDRYFDAVGEIIKKVRETQREPMEAAAQAIADANLGRRNVFAFGCNHAGLITLELFYRTGGLVTINPVRAPGMMLDISPIMMTSEMERMEGYGKVIFRNTGAKAGDVLIIHSVSGRNAVTVEMAACARQNGVKVIVLTNLNTSSKVASRHSSGKKLYELADILIDNCGDYGDAALSIENVAERSAPTSTAVGAAILNAVVARAIELIAQKEEAPVFMSGNLDGGDEHNRRVIAAHKANIFYM